MDLTNLFWFSVGTSFLGKFTHSRIDTDLGWLGKWIFVSPRAHHLHHKIDESSGRNFGDSFIFWDRMFNTYEEPNASIKNLTQGLPYNPYEEKNVFLAFFQPVLNFYLHLVGLKRKSHNS
jgi:sterol desaturase/sphingolipid hydroxylase (fatty acid hydroxylase superfamily)